MELLRTGDVAAGHAMSNFVIAVTGGRGRSCAGFDWIRKDVKMRTPGVSPGAYFPARPLRSRSAGVILWTGESKVHHRR